MATEAVEQMAVGATSDVGKVRANNEDAFRADAEAGLFVVSDGMGGQQAGELAARMVVDTLPGTIGARLDRMERPRGRAYRYWLRKELARLSRRVRDAARRQPHLRGMGATVVAALVRDRWAHIAHMGDSRAYLFRDGQLRQLTDDHSVVAWLLRKGEITPQEAARHPARASITRFVGMEDDAQPDVRSVALAAGDRLLLCTDGLTNMLPDESIAAMLGERADPQTTCEALVVGANAAGGQDNTTAVLVDFGGEGA